MFLVILLSLIKKNLTFVLEVNTKYFHFDFKSKWKYFLLTSTTYMFIWNVNILKFLDIQKTQWH